MAGAAVLLALAVLGFGAGGLFYSQKQEKRATWSLAGGGVLLFAALGLFFFKPSFSSIDARITVVEDKGWSATRRSPGPGTISARST